MISIEQRLDAIIRHLTAGSDADRATTLEELRQIAADAAPPEDRSMEYDVRRVLLDIGVPEHIVGHRYLVRAICLTVNEPELPLQQITKRLYPAVADMYQTTGSRVERAIRHAIEVAWDRGDLDTLHQYFGSTVSPLKGKPTNSEFIARIANVIRQYK